MYHAHFGLQKGLFGDGIAADTAVFRSAKHDQVSAHFKLALGSPNACVVLRGPPGIGKTTLTAATLRASTTRLALAWLNGMPTNPTELLELLLVELGINTLRTTRMERLQLWRQFQGEMRATETRLFVVVERTEDLSAEVLHALDQLTAPDAVGNPGANVVLLGHATIDDHLAVPLLESLRQRIRARTDLAPFTEPELQDYLRHQVACAGGHYDRIFAPGTVAAREHCLRECPRRRRGPAAAAADAGAPDENRRFAARARRYGVADAGCASGREP
jgi:type II secretory pathway predicted ATPase ExeA